MFQDAEHGAEAIQKAEVIAAGLDQALWSERGIGKKGSAMFPKLISSQAILV